MSQRQYFSSPSPSLVLSSLKVDAHIAVPQKARDCSTATATAHRTTTPALTTPVHVQQQQQQPGDAAASDVVVAASDIGAPAPVFFKFVLL